MRRDSRIGSFIEHARPEVREELPEFALNGVGRARLILQVRNVKPAETHHLVAGNAGWLLKELTPPGRELPEPGSQMTV